MIEIKYSLKKNYNKQKLKCFEYCFLKKVTVYCNHTQKRGSAKFVSIKKVPLKKMDLTQN